MALETQIKFSALDKMFNRINKDYLEQTGNNPKARQFDDDEEILIKLILQESINFMLNKPEEDII